MPAVAAQAPLVFQAKNRRIQDQVGDWQLILGPGGWRWFGQGGQALWREGEVDQVLPLVEQSLPEGDWALRADLGLLLEQHFPEALPVLNGLPAQVRLLSRQLPPPESGEAAFDMAVVLNLLGSAAEFLPRLLGPVEISLQELAQNPTVHGRVQVEPPVPPKAWQAAWYPPSLPESIGMLRFEILAADLWPAVEAAVLSHGFEPPQEPSGDWVIEIHALQIQGKLGLVFAQPPDWAFQSRDTEGFDLEAMGLGAFDPQDLDLPSWIGSWNYFFEAGDEVFWFGFGQEGFWPEVQKALQIDRPRPFAERRYRWPRGSLAWILDQQAAQEALRQTAPIPIPFMGGSGVRQQSFQGVLAVEGDWLRFHGSGPPLDANIQDLPGASSFQAQDFLLDRFLEQAVGDLIEQR